MSKKSFAAAAKAAMGKSSARRSVPLGARRICNPPLKNVLTY